MNTSKLVFIAVTLSILHVGCQKLSVGSENEVNTTESLGINCKTDAAIDTSSLAIQGSEVAAKGQSVVYKLNEDLGCSSSQKLSWKTVGSSAVNSGAAMTASYKKAGEYVVVAQVESSMSSSFSGKVATTSTTDISMKTIVVASQAAISGPDLGMVGSALKYQIALPSGMSLASADWNFGDGSAVQSGLGQVAHTYGRPGDYQISVAIVDGNQNKSTLSQKVTIVNIQDGLECVSDLAISGPTEANVNAPVAMSLYIPACLTNKITAVTWNLGDGSSSSNQSVTHTYSNAGDYQVTVQIYIGGDTSTPWVTLTHDIAVSSLPVDPEPSPTPAPSPTPDLNKCPAAGQQRETKGEIYSETVACGLNGTKVMSYRDTVVEECRLVGEHLDWVKASTSKDLLSEGSCQGQSCNLPDGSQIVNGSTKSSVITGEVSVALTCEFGETGHFSIYNQVSDLVCNNGQVSQTNTRQGTVKTPGSCPVYSYQATDTWSACSADCGGKQSRIYVCKDDSGNVVSNDRCKIAAPVEERVCDGNPAAVRRQEVSTSSEEANSSNKCPANQIGVIVQSRDVTNTKTYACIDHSVKLEKDETTYGAWVSQSYCRDYVAYRCSQDSLSNDEANGRYQWMVKCQDQVPVIKEFLEKFDNVKVGGNDIDTSARKLYPTFMNRATNPEKVWIAPKKASGSCVVPSTAYIAAVCVSSCATPEQQIIADVKAQGQGKYVTFIEALTKNYSHVVTLKNTNSMNSKAVEKTPVDQWVTELIDGEHDIIVFTMKSGRSIKLTPNHPVVASNGMMKLAGEFAVGDSLVELGGHLDAIVSLEHVKHYGKVYNLFVKSTEIQKNIVITNGYLNGTAFFQNEGAVNMNRALFKNKLTQGIFNK
ncbi:MAG: PKD domain-containing protein [Bdellovibrionales bacterium]|nr:PKD domain-containing protein [Bdellovibrionales bacterium]